jgi:hypothetical protein
MFFDKNYSKDFENFSIESGTCKLEGPYKHMHLRLCAEDCIDYETLAEA